MVSGEAIILSAEIVENLWAVWAPPRTPLGELTALSQTPQLVGRGLLPLPRNHTPLLTFGHIGLGSPMKNPGHALG